MKLTGRLTDVSDLSRSARDQMFALMERHYHNVSRAMFDADLAEKQWVIQIEDQETTELCGFSTQMMLDIRVGARPTKALFSGDTIIDRRYWGDQALTHVWGQLALSLVDEWPRTELFWFLISQGYKTYRFLPIFFHEFYPRHDVPTPDRIQDVLHALARQKFSDDYDPASGIVRSNTKQYRLREGLADITPERLRDPHVKFFNEVNPGHVIGDELCCLAPLSRQNFTDAAYRVIGLEP
ncbi:MAG: hypothetical protein SGJ20_08170 [Planctomycetota bacterium]|nr:hypothetical protein [Planctomycetota bacterium]